MKSYTDLEQSKVLTKILPLESADYYHAPDVGIVITTPYITYCGEERCVPAYKGAVPCCSLAAFVAVLPYPSLHKTFSGWRCDSYNKEGTSCILGEPSDNPVDACYEMILKLYELKML